MSWVGVLPKASSLCLSSDHFFLLHNRLHLLEGSSSSNFWAFFPLTPSSLILERLRDGEEQEPTEVCVTVLSFINESE